MYMYINTKLLCVVLQGTIATPAVCKLADRLAQHVGQNLHAKPHSKLLNTPFFM